MVAESKDKNRIINYLDMNADVHKNQVEKFSIKKLQNAFPEIDKHGLMEIESEWRKARNIMLNTKF